MSQKTYTIIGGGIVGLATAYKLSNHGRVIVLEAEPEIAMHQTGRNSGVIHSGIYYKPGSLKATNCHKGRQLLYDFCKQHAINHENCSKLIVATKHSEIPLLHNLRDRGIKNNLKGLQLLSQEEVKEREPHVNAYMGLLVPQTGIVDYKQVAHTLVTLIHVNGGSVLTNNHVKKINTEKNSLIISTNKNEYTTDYLINCAGLQSDRIARLYGISPSIKIIPFKGEYYELVDTNKQLVTNLIYPVPNPKYPFLGVHFTRGIHGDVEAGPNAVLAFKRNGYNAFDFSLKDFLSYTLYPGFWLFGIRHVKMGIQEQLRSLSRKLFLKSLQAMIPSINETMLKKAPCGIRAQALSIRGKLIDDFVIVKDKKSIHVLNAPSPAATACLSIADHIVNQTLQL